MRDHRQHNQTPQRRRDQQPERPAQGRIENRRRWRNLLDLTSVDLVGRKRIITAQKGTWKTHGAIVAQDSSPFAGSADQSGKLFLIKTEPLSSVSITPLSSRSFITRLTISREAPTTLAIS